MVIRGLTPDLARFMVRLSMASPTARRPLPYPEPPCAHRSGWGNLSTPGTQWEANNTEGNNIADTAANSAMTNSDSRQTVTNTSGNAGGNATGRTFDEDRVVLLTAHWTMEQ